MGRASIADCRTMPPCSASRCTGRSRLHSSVVDARKPLWPTPVAFRAACALPVKNFVTNRLECRAWSRKSHTRGVEGDQTCRVLQQRRLPYSQGTLPARFLDLSGQRALKTHRACSLGRPGNYPRRSMRCGRRRSSSIWPLSTRPKRRLHKVEPWQRGWLRKGLVPETIATGIHGSRSIGLFCSLW